MPHIRRASFLLTLLLAGLLGPVGALAAAVPPGAQQEPELSAEEAEAQDRIADEMAIVIFDLCVPVVRGSDVADTPGYEALGRPPLVDGSFVTSTGITVTPGVTTPLGCTFYPNESWQPRTFGFLLPLENQDQSREAGDWNPIPLRVGEAYHRLISRDARVGITIDRNYASGYVFTYKSTPEEVAGHFAAVWAAEFNPPGAAALSAFDACSSFMHMVAGDQTDDTPLVDVATHGRFGNTSGQVRGNIDASIWPSREGCEVMVQDATLTNAIAEALVTPGSGWSQVTDTSWTKDDGSRVELKVDGEMLDYFVRPGDFAQHDWSNAPWDWRGEEEPSEETPPTR